MTGHAIAARALLERPSGGRRDDRGAAALRLLVAAQRLLGCARVARAQHEHALAHPGRKVIAVGAHERPSQPVAERADREAASDRGAAHAGHDHASRGGHWPKTGRLDAVKRVA